MEPVHIVVPRHLHQRIKTLAELDQETNGVFLYTPHADKGKTSWHVHGFLLTGRGNDEHVQSHPSQLRLANKLLFDLAPQNT